MMALSVRTAPHPCPLPYLGEGRQRCGQRADDEGVGRVRDEIPNRRAETQLKVQGETNVPLRPPLPPLA